MTSPHFQSLAEFVAWYASMGFACFPIRDKYRVPCRGSHAHHDATTDVDAFVRLCERFDNGKRFGLGVRMGDLLADGGGYAVALDIDEKNGKSGSASLASRRFELVPTLTARTRSGGRHLIYRTPHPVGTKPDWLGKKSGLDIKGAGGWVAVAPTSGYVWDQAPALGLIAPAPGWLMNRSQRASSKGSGNSLVESRESVCCPAHEDKNPSLQITTLKDGRTLYYCFGGCSFAEVAAAVGIDAEAMAWAQAMGSGVMQ